MRERLKLLREEIERVDPLNWLYPPSEDGSVRGFDGVGPLVLVSYRPSTNPWPVGDPGRRRLYGTLTRFRLGEAHLTDCIKLRSPVEDDHALPANLQWHIDVLRRELDLINPPALIVFGEKAQRFLRRYPCSGQVAIIPVMHYANRFVAEEEVLVEILDGLLHGLQRQQSLTRDDT